jgi:glutathione synthase/RimK-type ligase-like ATP-grasp enzyme
MRFAFLAADPVHESVVLFASLLEARGHDVDVIEDGRRFLTEPANELDYELCWYRFSPQRDHKVPDLSWEAFLAFEAAGCRLINSSRSLMLARNKFLSAVRFKDSALDQPATELLCDDEPRFRPPYVVKPLFGALSEGMAVVQSHSDALAHAFGHGPCIVQRYFENAQVLRVISGREQALLVRDKGLDSGDAYASPRHPRAGEAGLCELAHRMILAVGGDLMGVDVLLHEGRPYALEVNGGFGFSADWREPGELIVSEFERLASERSPPR